MKEKRQRKKKGATFLPATLKEIYRRAKVHGRTFNGELNAIVNEAIGLEQEETPKNTPRKYLRGK